MDERIIVTHEELTAALERIARDPAFKGSDRLRRLLHYLCVEEISGRGDRLKAFAIATEALGRDDRFDPQSDSIVRVEVGRLRRALELYFATVGSNDEIRIVIPKGGYRPIIERAVSAESLDADSKQPLRQTVSGPEPETRRVRRRRRFRFGRLAAAALAAGGTAAAAFAAYLAFWPSERPLTVALSDITSATGGPSSRRDLIVPVVRMKGGDERHILLPAMLQYGLVTRLSGQLDGIAVTHIDRTESGQAVDLILRVALTVEGSSAVVVNAILVDASGAASLFASVRRYEIGSLPMMLVAEDIIDAISRDVRERVRRTPEARLPLRRRRPRKPLGASSVDAPPADGPADHAAEHAAARRHRIA